MAKTKTSKKRESGRTNEVAEQLEHAFLAGLGALSNTQKAGSKAFEKLVEQGQSFRKQTTNKTESLIDDVQDAIRGMADDAQSKASGLLDQMRETPQMEKFQSVFDARVASALDRIGVASKKDLNKLNSKLNKVLKAGQKKKPAAKKVVKTAPAKKAPAKKASTKKASTKKVSTKKASTKKTSTKKVSKKSN